MDKDENPIYTSSKNSNRFYINNYCWEHLVHWPVNKTAVTKPVYFEDPSEITSSDTAEDLSIRKTFVTWTVIQQYKYVIIDKTI